MFGSAASCEKRADNDVVFPRGYDFLPSAARDQSAGQLLQRPVKLVPEHELKRHTRELLRELVDFEHTLVA